MPHALQHRFENNPAFEKVATGLEDGPPSAYLDKDGIRLYVLLNYHIACFVGPKWKEMNHLDRQNTIEFCVEVELAKRREAERIKNGGTLWIVCKDCYIPLQRNPFDGRYFCHRHS